MAFSSHKFTRSRIKGLYVIVDADVVGERDIVEVTRAVLRGGAGTIQFRDKLHDKGDVLPITRRIRQLCGSFGASFIVNDHIDLAIACGADGVHLGQHDIPVPEARDMLGSTYIVGTSNALLEEAMLSISQGADYVAVGTIFPTKTKENTRAAGLDMLRRVKASVNVPVVAIGGINKENAREVILAGADALCVISAVVAAPDPEAATREIMSVIES